MRRDLRALVDAFVEQTIKDARELLKRDLESTERWTVALGGYVDRGVRRADVCSFVNRFPPSDADPNADDFDEASNASCDDNKLESGSITKDESRDGDRNSATANVAGSQLNDASFQEGNDINRDPAMEQERPPFDGYVKNPLANYHPVPGSIIPEPGWDQLVLEQARRVGIEKQMLKVVSPIQLGSNCEEVVETINSVDQCVYETLCRTRKSWFHDPDEARPGRFHFGPLKGQKRELAKLLGYRDERSFETLARGKGIWVAKRSRFEYEIYFVDERRFTSALQRFEKRAEVQDEGH